MTRAVLAALVLIPLACTRSPPPAPPDAGPQAALAADAGVPLGPERVVFASPAWTGARGACTEDTAKDGCDSEWHHTESQQLVRVFVVDVQDEAALPRFVDKLSSDVRARGGVAERIDQGGLTVVRFLEQAQQAVDGGVLSVATLNYALIGRDKRAVHLITSVVPFDDQQTSDERLRALLTTAAWSAEIATARSPEPAASR